MQTYEVNTLLYIITTTAGAWSLGIYVIRYLISAYQRFAQAHSIYQDINRLGCDEDEEGAGKGDMENMTPNIGGPDPVHNQYQYDKGSKDPGGYGHNGYVPTHHKPMKKGKPHSYTKPMRRNGHDPHATKTNHETTHDRLQIDDSCQSLNKR